MANLENRALKKTCTIVQRRPTATTWEVALRFQTPIVFQFTAKFLRSAKKMVAIILSQYRTTNHSRTFMGWEAHCLYMATQQLATLVMVYPSLATQSACTVIPHLHFHTGRQIGQTDPTLFRYFVKNFLGLFFTLEVIEEGSSMFMLF